MPIAVIDASEAWWACSETPAKVVVPRVANAIMIASERPISPTRFITNAFFEAVAYAGFLFQKPIKRYEARPTPSHPT